MCCSFSHVWVLALFSLLPVRKPRPRDAEELALTSQVDQYQILSPKKGGLDCGGTLRPCHSAPSSSGHSRAVPSLACDMCIPQQPTHLHSPEWSSHFDLGAGRCNPAHLSAAPHPMSPSPQPAASRAKVPVSSLGARLDKKRGDEQRLADFFPPLCLVPAQTPSYLVSWLLPSPLTVCSPFSVQKEPGNN